MFIHGGISFMKSGGKSQNNKYFNFLSRYLTKKLILIIVIIAVFATGTIGSKKFFSYDSKTTKIGLEDIGELATQSAYCTEVNVTEASRELFGLEIPFTQSKYVYSYDVVIKAGYDFSKIQWSVKGNTIEVRLPTAKILGKEIKTDSFKVYHEKESIFRHITLAENNEAMNSLKQTAEENAVANGLLEEARNNGESILKGFFANVYDLDEYEIVFTD